MKFSRFHIQLEVCNNTKTVTFFQPNVNNSLASKGNHLKHHSMKNNLSII